MSETVSSNLEVKRFQLVLEGATGFIRLDEHESGNWVHWQDYERLQTKLNECVTGGPRNYVHKQFHAQVVEEKDAEIARLRALLPPETECHIRPHDLCSAGTCKVCTDAARYRWLRDIGVFALDETLAGGDLDNAVDAERQALAGKETFEGRGPDDAEFGTAEWRRDQPEPFCKKHPNTAFADTGCPFCGTPPALKAGAGLAEIEKHLNQIHPDIVRKPDDPL